MFVARKKEIELSMTGLENESRDLKSRLGVEKLTPERIKDIHSSPLTTQLIPFNPSSFVRDRVPWMRGTLGVGLFADSIQTPMGVKR
jgi:hypothetical protein